MTPAPEPSASEIGGLLMLVRISEESGRGDWIRTSDPFAQGKLGAPRKVLILERFAASENSWAQIWAHPSGDGS
jgi:hypothetical protein